MKLNIGDYLIASPYSDETDLDGNLTEEVFFNDYFLKMEEYDHYSSELDRLFNHTAHQLPLTVYFYGYSGTGKTTFLRWFCKNEFNTHETVFFDFANVVGSQHYGDETYSSDKGLRIFDDKMRDILCSLFPDHDQVLKKLLERIDFISPHIQTTFSARFFEELSKLKIDPPDKFRNNYFSFVRNIGYLDLLLVLFLFYYHDKISFLSKFSSKNTLNDKLPLLIVFDNIDHVEIESENSKFPSQIEIVYHNFRSIIRVYKDLCKNEYQKEIENNKTIKFLFCMRDSNVTLLNRQAAENTINADVYFCPAQLDKNILLRRIQIAEDHGVRIEKNRKELLEYILNDIYTKRVFLPLFNLNIRKLAHLLADTIVPHNGSYLELMKKLNMNKKTVVGARGIEFYLIIKQLQKTDFLKDTTFVDDGGRIGGQEGGYVNPARIILTNLLNLTHFSLDARIGKPYYTPTGLFDLYQKYSEIFKNRPAVFFEVISKLFHAHRSNWCHLLTFQNKQIFHINNFEHELESVKEYESLKQGSDSKKHDIVNNLNKIKVLLNPSGYIYIKDIVKHYEQFSIKANNQNPLFASLNHRKVSHNMLHFEFIDNIKETKIVTKECVESLKKFLNSNVVQDFESSSHVFRTYNIEEGENEDYHENRTGRLLIVRIIHTHISYIDDFRIYILNNNEYWESIQGDAKQLYSIKVRVNRAILSHVQDYIDMLKGTNGTVQYLIDMFERNISIINKTNSFKQRLLD